MCSLESCPLFAEHAFPDNRILSGGFSRHFLRAPGLCLHFDFTPALQMGTATASCARVTPIYTRPLDLRASLQPAPTVLGAEPHTAAVLQVYPPAALDADSPCNPQCSSSLGSGHTPPHFPKPDISAVLGAERLRYNWQDLRFCQQRGGTDIGGMDIGWLVLDVSQGLGQPAQAACRSVKLKESWRPAHDEHAVLCYGLCVPDSPSPSTALCRRC